MGNRNYVGVGNGSSNQAGGLAKGGGPRRSGPYLDVYCARRFVLTERGKTSDVTPEYDGDELRIGCTTVSRKALEKIIKLVESSK